MQPSPASTRRLAIATSGLIVCCLLSTIRILNETPSPGQPRTDAVELRSDQRFAALKQALPQQGIVGYVGNADSPADYYLAQYALAPLVVDHSSNHSLVVGNFSVSPPPALLPDHLRLGQDFGNGVLLFANKGAQ